MTFPARLTELLEKATKGPITYSEYCSRNGAYQRLISNPSGIQKIWIGDINKECNAELIAYLVNHAEAIRDLVVAAEKAQEAMMVWTNTYAPEMCDPEGVKKSQELLNEGGTLYYIATVSQSLSEALAKLEEA